ncbi:crotonase/enoyl-CoA hydratase family protein [Tianweitania sp. BSSL-BM11]|uniref:Crotonase/enoyl-CoA hydratase family protein n=1 Tax=Tianweitania aestuarii TaxID=2814886 RepID=A0ABS5RRW2_9HYPH|nr:crotonase/enoyl-CoA hydratase family protein [Tianweitania aestuarii]MBS9719756.1 crotonase/enoyl-CoA hydratase family protein [Tianweitania aestuarii]
MSELIQNERRGAVNVIRINRPDKKNALTFAMYAAMAAALRAGDADESVRVHVILGVPGAFSAGNDLADFVKIASGESQSEEIFDFLRALATTRKPLVSGADGIAVGIGATLHLHCDLTFATPRTALRTPFVDLGIVPEAGSSLLVPERLGHQPAFALLVMGDPLGAEAARQGGLIHAVVDEEDLEAAVFAAADRLASKPANALRIARELIRGSRTELLQRIDEEAEAVRTGLKSDEARAAFAAFLNKKKG